MANNDQETNALPDWLYDAPAEEDPFESANAGLQEALRSKSRNAVVFLLGQHKDALAQGDDGAMPVWQQRFIRRAMRAMEVYEIEWGELTKE